MGSDGQVLCHDQTGYGKFCLGISCKLCAVYGTYQERVGLTNGKTLYGNVVPDKVLGDIFLTLRKAGYGPTFGIVSLHSQ